MPAVPNSRLLQDRFPCQYTQKQKAVTKPIVLLSLGLQAMLSFRAHVFLPAHAKLPSQRELARAFSHLPAARVNCLLRESGSGQKPWRWCHKFDIKVPACLQHKLQIAVSSKPKAHVPKQPPFAGSISEPIYPKSNSGYQTNPAIKLGVAGNVFVPSPCCSFQHLPAAGVNWLLRESCSGQKPWRWCQKFDLKVPACLQHKLPIAASSKPNAHVPKQPRFAGSISQPIHPKSNSGYKTNRAIKLGIAGKFFCSEPMLFLPAHAKLPPQSELARTFSHLPAARAPAVNCGKCSGSTSRS